MNEEAIRRAAARMEDAAQEVTRAADRIEESARRIAILFEDGYGGSGLQLLEALEKHIHKAPGETGATGQPDGALKLPEYQTCPKCKGERYIQFMRWGIVPAAEACDKCGGSGKVRRSRA